MDFLLLIRYNERVNRVLHHTGRWKKNVKIRDQNG